MFCPKCGSEYREGYTVCSDCGVALIQEKPILPEDKRIFAGFSRRFIALLIDIIVASVIILPVLYINLIFMSKMTVGQYFLIWFSSLLIEIVPFWLYNTLLESSKHKGSLGKIALKIVVVDSSGSKISFGQASARFFAKILSTMFFYVGFIMVGFTKKKQGLHDIMANTYVVKSGYELDLSSQLQL